MRKAPSASIVDVEKPVSPIACEPNATTSIASAAGLVVTKASAAAEASAIDGPAIERERSTASTTLAALPRLVAVAPLTSTSFSKRRGFAVLGVSVTTDRLKLG